MKLIGRERLLKSAYCDELFWVYRLSSLFETFSFSRAVRYAIHFKLYIL